MRCHPPATLDEDNHTLTPFDPQERANSYNDFIQSANSFNNATTRINEELITPTDANPKGIDRIDRPTAEGSTSNTTDLKQDTSSNASDHSDKSTNDPHLTNEHSTDDDE